MLPLPDPCLYRSVAAIALWFVTIAVAVFSFVRAQTQVMPDGRRAVMLTPFERNLVLTEMRGRPSMVIETLEGLATNLSVSRYALMVQPVELRKMLTVGKATDARRRVGGSTG